MFFMALFVVFWALPAITVLLLGYTPEDRYIESTEWSDAKYNWVWVAMVLAPVYNFDCSLEVIFAGPGSEREFHK